MILKNGKRLDGCSDTVPIGTLNPYMGSVAPYGYLICEGQLVSKTTYKELYEICGDAFGIGTTTEFRLPDLRGKTIVGYKEGDSTFGTLGGLLGSLTHAHSTGNHTLTIAEIPAHNHQLESVTGTDDLNFINGDGSFHIQNSDTTVGFSAAKNAGYKYGSTYSTTGGGQAHNHGDTGESSSLQPSLTMSWIVKAFLLMPNQSYVENSLTSSSEINALSAKQGKLLNDKFNNYTTTANLPSVLDDRYLKSVQLLEPTVFTGTLSSRSAHHTFTLKDNPLNYKFLIVTTQESHDGSDVNWYGATHVIVPQYDDAPSEGERQSIFCASSIFQPGYAWYRCFPRSTDNFTCRVFAPNGTDGTEVKFRVVVFGIK